MVGEIVGQYLEMIFYIESFYNIVGFLFSFFQQWYILVQGIYIERVIYKDVY